MKFTDIYLNNEEACKDAICFVLGLPVPKVRLNRAPAAAQEASQSAPAGTATQDDTASDALVKAPGK